MGFSPEFFLQLLVAIGGIFGAYAVVRERLATLQERIDSHIKLDDDRHVTIEARQSENRRSIDDLREHERELSIQLGRLEGKENG